MKRKIAVMVLLAATVLTSASVASARKLTIFLAGDSTMAVKAADRRPETGWGEMFAGFFKPGSVIIENRAMNGRSTKSFISEGRWQAIVDDLTKGDYVFIQFGHNDASRDKGERYTPPDEFRRNLVRFVTEVRERKAIPVLLTPVMRRRFDAQGRFFDTHGEYPDIVRSVARESKVALIDAHRETEKLIVQLGVEESKHLFLILAKGEHPNYPNGIDDNTHFSPKGAKEVATLVVEGIREAKLKLRKRLN